ncbi:MAG: hypothetical protein OXG51_09620 [Gammaproteobacteria bacterium]|nr:hypothetical protein [Gammaproteobacteria bacterium]MCY3794618.1 hypothetical protein [Gammaproteobacteria bacterium]
MEPLQADSRSIDHRPLGLDGDSAAKAIDWGQADFDQPFGTLSAEDRVLLYGYWNQKRHVEELSEAFRQIFGASWPDEPLIVIDLGCGPFTGGLALAGQLSPNDSFDYIGIDRSWAMRQLGERFAYEADAMDGLPRIDRRWAPSITDVNWPRSPGWRPVVVIVSFLLASPSLDVEDLVQELNDSLDRLSRGETTLIYTNSTKPGPNRNLQAFQAALERVGFRSRADDVGTVPTKRRMLKLRYALFHRPRQRILRLGES